MLLLVLAFPLDMSPNLWSLVQRYFVLWRRLTDRSIVDDWTATNGEQINHSHTGICLLGLAVQSDVRRVSVTVASSSVLIMTQKLKRTTEYYYVQLSLEPCRV